MYFKLRCNSLIPVCPSDIPVANPTKEDFANAGAYEYIDDGWMPDVSEGCRLVHDGYELIDGAWHDKWKSEPLEGLSDTEREQIVCQEEIKDAVVGDVSAMSFSDKDALLKKVILAVQPII